MDITINTPALLFPALSLVMLAYTNRFLAISSLARNLHARYSQGEASTILKLQIKNLRFRLRLVRQMQLFGALSFLISIVSMYFIYQDKPETANILFAISLICFAVSLILSLVEIWKSTASVELQLSDIEEDELNPVVGFFRDRRTGGKQEH